MSKFFQNFFSQTYNDSLGEGSFGYRHLIWMGACVIFFVFVFLLFRKYKRAAAPTMVIVCAIMFVIRLANQTYRAIQGYEIPWYAAFPWHLCTVMSFLLPIVVIFRIRALRTAVYSAAMLGGIITILMGEYFSNSILTIFDLESMWVHMALIAVPLADIASGNFSFKLRNYWQTCLGMLSLIGWASLANYIIFKGYDVNYMYLVSNGLPFEVKGIHFFIIYVLIFFILSMCLYLPATICAKRKAKIARNSQISGF